MQKLILLAILATLHALPASAQVFRCIDAGSGRVTYSDVPCQDDKAGGAVIIQQNTIDTSGSREQALRHELRVLQQRMDTYENTTTTRPAYGRTEADLQAERANSLECEQAKRSHYLEASSMTRTQASVEAKAAAMRSACGIREPDRVEFNRYAPERSSVRGGHRPPPGVITNCDNSGCWDSNGVRYHRGAGNTFIPGTGGPACQIVGNQLHCP